MATSVQDMVHSGNELDLYYYDAETSKRQTFPTTQNTKYTQQFANLTGGSSVFTLSPNNGVQDVVCSFTFAGLSSYAGLALPRGWGYALIKQVSFRYGGSSQYFLTGDQILQNAFRDQTNRNAMNDLLTIGGNVVNSSTTTGVDLTANIVLVLPHNTASGVNKQHPLPSDALTQQIQITVELYPVSSIWSVVSGSTAPTSLSQAIFRVQQVMFNNQGDALARRVDMSVNAYAFPCEFVQQKQTISLANTATSQSVVLTGFRSGEVKSIEVWLTRASDTTSVATGYNPFNWVLPTSVTMTYAGDIYARYEQGSSQLWNLINDNKAPVVDNTQLVVSGGTNFTANSVVSSWVHLPFAQTLVDEDAHYILIHGKPITNGIVNLDIVTPTAQSDWVLNVSYVYNSTLLFSQGTCDYIF
jgi:hypothetical protein